MRFVVASLLGLGLLGSSSVSAACTYGPIDDVQIGKVASGTPDQDSVTLFVSDDPTVGNFAVGFLADGLTGLDGADRFCQNQALKAEGSSAAVDKYVTANADKFKAVMSNMLVNAIDRFDDVYTTHDVVDSNGGCIAAEVSDLFKSMNLEQLGSSQIYNNFGNQPGVGTHVWTGSTATGLKWKASADYIFDGVSQELADTDLDMQAAYCSDVSSGTFNPTDQGWNRADLAYDTMEGRIRDTVDGKGFFGQWLSHGPTGCNNGWQVLCLQSALAPTLPPTTESTVTQDPQFVGLQGQSFQVHGMPDEFFNLISLPDFQLNSRFAFLASGQCNYNNTECWTHPGTYVDQLGFMFPSLNIKTVSGSHQRGMQVWVNEQRVEPSHATTTHTIATSTSNSTEQVVSISHPRHDKLVISSPLFTITVTNSDMFFNFGVSLHSPRLLTAGAPLHHLYNKQDEQTKYPVFPMHGLLGQTWRNARYAHGKMFQGNVDDYMLLDTQLFSTKFMYNMYKH